MSTEPKETGIYGRYWDYYVDQWQELHGSEELEWPGDEWGNPDGWEGMFRSLFVPAGVETWQRAVEIGPGSGKYSLKVLEASTAEIRAYDVSERFLAVCRERCAGKVDAGRLELRLLGVERPDEMLADLDAAGWRRSADAVFSIDAMVHVDLQYLIVYLITAALVLRPGGKLVLTLTNVTSDAGFEKLIRDVAWTYHAQERPIGSGKFEWLSPDIVRSVLPRLGFEIEILSDAHRDLRLVAALADPALADSLEPVLLGQSAG